MVVRDVLWLGYPHVLLKSDNEPANLKLFYESLRELRISGLEQVLSENAPEYDPQSMINSHQWGWGTKFSTVACP